MSAIRIPCTVTEAHRLPLAPLIPIQDCLQILICLSKKIRVYTAHVTLVGLCQYFDNDLPVVSGAKHRVDRRQVAVESCIDDAAAHGGDSAGILAHEFSLLSGLSGMPLMRLAAVN